MHTFIGNLCHQNVRSSLQLFKVETNVACLKVVFQLSPYVEMFLV